MIRSFARRQESTICFPRSWGKEQLCRSRAIIRRW